MFINKQSKTITDALQTSLIDALIKEAELTSAESLLDHRQRKCVLRTLKLLSSNLTNQLLPLTFKYSNGNA